MSTGRPDREAFRGTMREVWRTAGGYGTVPLTSNGFQVRMADQVDDVLAESYFEEMCSMRDRLNEASRLVVMAAVERSEALSRGQIEELSVVGRSAAALGARLSAAILLDVIEGHIRQTGDPPVSH